MSSYRLLPPRGRATAPCLDADQQRVVDHPGGPLLVLAGPGTGKTTTLVEAVVDRVERRGADPESVLALTFSRKAAEQLRDRVTARLGRTVATPVAATFHSFAYGLIHRFAPAELYAAPLRLLSAPEQDVVLAELLSHAPESVHWPETLHRAVGTRGFAREVQAVLARAREKGLDGDDLRRLGEEHRRPELVAAGLFLDQYLHVLDSQDATDYADLVRRAVVEAERHREELRARFRHVLVDEYQDTDPGQVALLRAIAGDGRDLVVVGDPHQSIYAFRGAEVRGLLDFPTQFPRADGSPADVVALRTSRRCGPRLLATGQRVAGRLPVPGSVDRATRAAFLRPVAAAPPSDHDRVEVLTFDTDRAESEHVADLLRRAHLGEGLPWSDMAVLVRSGRTSIPALRRSLTVAGVPVEVAADDTPLTGEPAVLALLAALRAVVDLTRPADEATLFADQVEALLVSPLAGMDSTELRALGRALRARERVEADTAGRPPRPSPELVREAVLDPGALTGLEGPGAGKAAGLVRLLHRARARLQAGGTAEEVLWVLWDGTRWPRRLRDRAEAGGPGARLAHRDLDAVVALFEAAARVEEVRGHTGVRNFLAAVSAQQIPADTLAERGVRGAAVRLLTAHRAKGLEWPLVVVAHVQEESWPDLRRRSTLLPTDRIGVAGLQPEVSTRALLTEERRLFYVACTRARRRLVVTAVASPDQDGEQPSRFLTELGVGVDHRRGRPVRPLSLPGLVADLRRTVAEPASSPGLRQAAARRLARLAAEEVGGRPLVPAADPATWWGTLDPSESAAPVRPADQPVELSASALAGLLDCPARWFLEREAGGARPTSQAQGFGNVVHALADRIARGELRAGPGDVDALMEQVDAVWGRLRFRTPWSAAREREEVRKALGRFLAWHHRPGARTVLATEHPLRAEVTLPDGQRIVVTGYADRLEVDDVGHVVVVDLKTGKYPPPDRELTENPQLALYQYAVDHGALDDLAPGLTVGGAELWQVRKEVRGRLKVQAQPPQRPDPDGRRAVEEQLMRAARAVREERFEARPGPYCERCDFTALCPAQTTRSVLS